MVSLLEQENAIDIVKGSSKTLALSVVDGSGAVVNLTGCRVVMTVKCSINDTSPEIQKDSARSALEAVITEPLAGKAEFYLQPSDTANMDPGKYVFDVWVILSSGARYMVVGPGSFNVSAGVTVLT